METIPYVGHVSKHPGSNTSFKDCASTLCVQQLYIRDWSLILMYVLTSVLTCDL